MKKIYNVTPLGLLIDMTKRAVRPCESTMVSDEVAEELVAGGSWSYENPRKPPVRAPREDET